MGVAEPFLILDIKCRNVKNARIRLFQKLKFYNKICIDKNLSIIYHIAMKRMGIKIYFLLVLMVISLAIPVTAQEAAISVAYGIEFGFNSKLDFGGGFVLGFDVDLPGQYAIGFNMTAITNKHGTSFFEPTAMFRYYFSDNHTGFFAQADGGAVFSTKNSIFSYGLTAGVRGGYRVLFGKFCYVEPYLRAGLFYFSGGIISGFRL